MRYELNQFKALFEQICDLGANGLVLPNTKHTRISDNISVWFDEDYTVAAIYFGDEYNDKVEIMKYSNRDDNYKLSLPINMTDEDLAHLLIISTKEYHKLRITHLLSEVELDGLGLIGSKGELVEFGVNLLKMRDS